MPWTARPGDVLGFSAWDLVGCAINLATGGVPFVSCSHVAIVVTLPEFDGPVVCESTTLSDRPCLLTHKRASGVQFHPLRERVKDYGGKVYHYPLRPTLLREDYEKLGKWTAEQAGKGYDYFGAARCRRTLLGLLERAVSRENLERLYCSELVVAALKVVRRMEPGQNASAWDPNRLLRHLVRTGVTWRGKLVSACDLEQ